MAGRPEKGKPWESPGLSTFCARRVSDEIRVAKSLRAAIMFAVGVELDADPDAFEGAGVSIVGDYVRVLGTVRGTAKGRIPLLATLDAVAVRAETAEVVDRDSLAPPALRTVEVAQSVDQHRLVATVDKVEFAANETRVYVSVSNQSTATAMLNGTGRDEKDEDTE